MSILFETKGKNIILTYIYVLLSKCMRETKILKSVLYDYMYGLT